MNSLKALLIGPLANPVALTLTHSIITISGGSPFDPAGAGYLFLASTVLSYAFIGLFFLPIYLAMHIKKWFTPPAFFLGTFISTLLFGFTFDLIGTSGEDIEMLTTVFFLTSLNSLLMCAVTNQKNKDDQSKAVQRDIH